MAHTARSTLIAALAATTLGSLGWPPAEVRAAAPGGEPVRPAPAAIAGQAAVDAAAAPSAPAAGAAPPSTDTPGGIAGFFRQTEVTGSVDAYYSWSFNRRDPVEARNFDVAHDQFSFSLAELVADKRSTPASRLGFRVDVGGGPAADLVNGGEPGGPNYWKAVQQGYAGYLVPLGRGVQVDVGKFVTPFGAEVIETRDNWNYSRGLLFTTAVPYYHFGVRLAYPVVRSVTLSGYVVNGWNDVRDNNASRTLGLSVAVKPNTRFSLTQHFMTGPEQSDNEQDRRSLVDAVATFAATPSIALLGEALYGHDTLAARPVSWYGLATSLRYQVWPALAVSPRYEWFRDPQGFTTGSAQTLQEFTVTGECRIAGLVARLEFRRDRSTAPFFDAWNGMRGTRHTLAFGLLYAFASAK
jgi:hypothetical protein